MADELRSSGIALIGDVPWGTHLCHFYETTQDLLDMVVPYFKAGLEHHEYCLWVISDPISHDDARQALSHAVPDLDRHLAERSIEILTHDQWYLKDGIFDLHRVIAGWKEKLAEARARGYEGLRVSGNTAWIEENDWRDFHEYEKELNNTAANQRMLVLCTYRLAATSAAEVLDVARSHQQALALRHGTWEVIEAPELRESKAEIRRLNEELERRVAERTRELASANAELRREIAERQRADESLQKSVDFVERLMQTANVMFLQLDTAGRVERINTAAEEITGYSRVEVEGRNWFETLVPRERYPYVWEQFTRLLQSGQLPSTFENPVLTKQGEERQILWKNNVLRDGDRTVGTISFGIDISERKRAEAERERLFKEVQEGRERLQTLSDQSFVAQETERRSLARELHDEIGQTLTAVQTNLQALQLSSDPSVFAARLGDSMRITDHALQQVRELSLDLRPAMLDDLGLIPALEWYIAREAERSGLKMQFNTQPDHIRLTSTVETACFRVTQAALTNVVRHAQARYVWVGLQQEGAEIVLTIRDDGVGFDVPRALERAAHGQSLGLLSMQERVRLAGGRLDIQSAAKRGTTIHARFPLAATAAADVAQAEIP